MSSVAQRHRRGGPDTRNYGGRRIKAGEKQAMVERYVYAYNAFDIDTMLSLLHPAVEFQNISNGQVTVQTKGIDEFHALALQGKTLFSSRKQTIMHYAEKNNSATIEVVYAGVLAIDLPEGLKAGETLNLSGKSEFTFRDGKIYSLTDIVLD
ncbi:nuclear transport factor 2 family protein [Desulfosediminicola ganghwensis]|uniref:nuclear transport factor 2 family protein n=1 Tax=Desulfosediminicola ganghwensis TaxID=2569540 RepID=UPI0010ACCD94|nr:nuclear transport factor 2 family protein [Desulfosediminicola ganghwensis]